MYIKRKYLTYVKKCSAIATLLMVLMISSTGAHAASPLPLKRILSKPRTAPSSIYYGVYTPGWLDSLANTTAFEHDAGKAPSIIMWYQGWGVQDSSRYFETSWMNNVRNHGAIPLVSWEPWNYTQGINQPSYSLKNIINGHFDSYIIKWANDSKAWGHPYFLRFAAEMNGNWYPWSEQVNGNSAGLYVKAWRHVHDIFTAQGVTNVTWIWAPNVEYPGSIPLRELYPGNAYVDWIGMDGYNWSYVDGHHWQSFSDVFSQTYKDVVSMATDKPIMVAETASAEVGGNKANWITDAFTVQIPTNFPLVKSVTWFNDNKETDWRIESSDTAQQAFARGIANPIYASNQYANLNVSPIPVATQLNQTSKKPPHHK